MSSQKDTNFDVKKVNDTWYIRDLSTNCWGMGDSLDSAYGDLEKRLLQFKEFEEKSGFLPVETRHAALSAQSMKGGFLRTMKTFTIVALCCIPVSYAISTAFTRTLENHDLRGGRVFWEKVEQKIIGLGNPEKGPTPEKIAEMEAALDSAIKIYRPLISKLGLVFEPIEEETTETGESN